MHVWQNAHANTVRRAMERSLFSFFLNFTTLLKGLCVYIVFLKNLHTSLIIFLKYL